MTGRKEIERVVEKIKARQAAVDRAGKESYVDSAVVLSYGISVGLQLALNYIAELEESPADMLLPVRIEDND